MPVYIIRVYSALTEAFPGLKNTYYLRYQLTI